MKKAIFSLFVFLLLVGTVVADVTVTDLPVTTIEGDGIVREATWWDKFLSNFELGAVATTQEDMPSDFSDCDYTKWKVFSKTYSPTDVIPVGSVCSDNSKVVLFMCKNNICELSSLVSPVTAYKIDGVHPRFTGFAVDTYYAYKCFDCEVAGTYQEPEPTPSDDLCVDYDWTLNYKSCKKADGGVCSGDGRYYCQSGNLFILEDKTLLTDYYFCYINGQQVLPSFQQCPSGTSCQDGTCQAEQLVCQPNVEFCDGNKLKQCSSDGMTINTLDVCSSDEICKELTGTSAMCEAKEKRYGVTCSGQFCYCTQQSTGNYTSIEQCNFEAKKKTDELNREDISYANSKKITLSKQDIYRLTTTQLIGSACLSDSECYGDEEGFKNQCWSLNSLKDAGLLSDTRIDDFLEHSKAIVTGLTVGTISGLVACPIIGVAGSVFLSPAFFATTVPCLGIFAGGGAIVGEGVKLIFEEDDPLVKALKAKDSSQVGLCVFEEDKQSTSADLSGLCPSGITNLPRALGMGEPNCLFGWGIAIALFVILITILRLLFGK